VLAPPSVFEDVLAELMAIVGEPPIDVDADKDDWRRTGVGRASLCGCSTYPGKLSGIHIWYCAILILKKWWKCGTCRLMVRGCLMVGRARSMACAHAKCYTPNQTRTNTMATESMAGRSILRGGRQRSYKHPELQIERTPAQKGTPWTIAVGSQQ
jgi:hypothetical protein